MLPRSGAVCYRDRSIGTPIFGTCFGGLAAVLAVIYVILTVNNGGSYVTVNGQREFWPVAKSVVFVILFCSPFVSIGVIAWLYVLNNKVVLDDDGIRSVNLFGRTDFSASWSEISEPKTIFRKGAQTVQIKAGSQELDLGAGHPHIGEILARIRAELKKLSGTEVPEASEDRSKDRVFESRPDVTFKYPPIGWPVKAALPASVVAAFVMTRVLLGLDSIAGVLFFLLIVAYPVFAIIHLFLRDKNTRVYVERFGLRITNALGKDLLNAAWDDVTGLFYEGQTAAVVSDFPIEYYNVYRIESGAQKARVRSSLMHFGDFMGELRNRLPKDVFYAEQYQPEEPT